MNKGEKTTLIYGRHPVREALRSRSDVVKKVMLAGPLTDPELKNLIAKAGISTGPFDRTIDDGVVHQGIAALIAGDELLQDYPTFITKLSITTDTLLVLVDELEDPHNLGAIIRSAAAFGAAAVLLPQQRSASVTGAVIKVSAGAAFQVPLVTIGNVNQTIRDLKERKFWVYGLEAESDETLVGQTFDTPTVFILGNEARGIRLKTRELCDVLVSIPIHRRSESLNVAASSAVALYQWSQTRPRVLAQKTT